MVSVAQLSDDMKHITEYRTDNGTAFNGYRVSISKKNIVFCKYIPAKGIGWDAARNEAIEFEAELASKLAECDTVEEILKLRESFR